MRSIALVLAGLALTGCVASREMPLSRNVVRIDTAGTGLIGSMESGRHTMRRAAQLTIEAGYQRFVLVDASQSGRTDTVGYIPGQANTNLTWFGNTGYATTTYTPAQPIRVRRTNVGVTVIMLNPGDQGFEQGFDAAEVLERLKT